MKVKIDTKEKMHVITPEDDELTVNMAEQLIKQVHSYLESPVQNIILNFRNVKSMNPECINLLQSMQQSFYEAGHSMVFCEFHPDIENLLHQRQLTDEMNITPTESEAWDIVQMEEIERELL